MTESQVIAAHLIVQARAPVSETVQRETRERLAELVDELDDGDKAWRKLRYLLTRDPE